MNGQPSCNPCPTYSKPGSLLFTGTSDTRFVAANPMRKALMISGNGPAPSLFAVYQGDVSVRIPINAQQPYLTIDEDTYGEMARGAWAINTNGANLTISWVEIIKFNN